MLVMRALLGQSLSGFAGTPTEPAQTQSAVTTFSGLTVRGGLGAVQSRCTRRLSQLSSL